MISWKRYNDYVSDFEAQIDIKFDSGEKCNCSVVPMAHICANFYFAYPYYGSDGNGHGSSIRE